MHGANDTRDLPDANDTICAARTTRRGTELGLKIAGLRPGWIACGG